MSERTAEQERSRQQLIDAVKAWREARCLNADVPFVDGHRTVPCDGDNHVEECPSEIARQDILAAHNKVELLRAG